jgi:hypothetical protein
VSGAVAETGAERAPSAAPARDADVRLHLDALTFDYEPYPIGLVRAVFDPRTYAEMVDSFPGSDDFVAKYGIGAKQSLSQLNNRRAYARFIQRHAVWRRFHAYVKSAAFIAEVDAALRRLGIDLGLAPQSFAGRMRQRLRALKRGRPLPRTPTLRARFEFSAMSSAGGHIRPHTDDPAKIVTLVISMVREGEWQPAWGGGTSVVWPLDATKSFNPGNQYLDFDQVRTLKTLPFEPNQGIVFVKTPSSWHMVAPMTGNDPQILRRTLTINIESS